MTLLRDERPKGDGANYGGLAGADAYCQTLAAAAGRGDVQWVAYLSTQGPNAVNARDRIGAGPWFNARGQQIAANVAELHGDTIEQARLGNRDSEDHRAQREGGAGERRRRHAEPARHPDGFDTRRPRIHRCRGPHLQQLHEQCGGDAAARGPAGAPGPSVQVGHHDRLGGPNASWNSVHASRGCSQANLVSTGGAGLLYCFAPGRQRPLSNE